MRKQTFSVISRRDLSSGVYELVLGGDASDFTRPGQFAEISVPGRFLRRPISVCDWTDSTLTLLIRCAGDGTRLLRDLSEQGARLDVITGLGNGFDVDAPAARLDSGDALLVGGGIGIAPLYGLARRLTEAGHTVHAILGFRNSSDMFYAHEFRSLGCDVHIATEDGSEGTKGFVTDVIKSRPDFRYAFACGPMPMLRAMAALPQLEGGQFSLEARMGCGFGACVGCTIKTASGSARVCKEGPVFPKEAIRW